MNLLKIIEDSLTPEIKTYTQSLFFDSRRNQPISQQIFAEPLNLFEAVKVFKQYHDMLPKAIKSARPDLHTLALKLEKTTDDIERIAIWASEYSDQ